MLAYVFSVFRDFCTGYYIAENLIYVLVIALLRICFLIFMWLNWKEMLCSSITNNISVKLSSKEKKQHQLRVQKTRDGISWKTFEELWISAYECVLTRNWSAYDKQLFQISFAIRPRKLLRYCYRLCCVYVILDIDWSVITPLVWNSVVLPFFIAQN